MDKPHKRLKAWESGMDLVLKVSNLTGRFPRQEQYDLTSQLRRAAESIPANIAEGAARRSRKEFIQFLHISQGSLRELDTHLELANRLGYLPSEHRNALEVEMVTMDKMISGLIKHQKGARGKVSSDM